MGIRTGKFKESLNGFPLCPGGKGNLNGEQATACEVPQPYRVALRSESLTLRHKAIKPTALVGLICMIVFHFF